MYQTLLCFLSAQEGRRFSRRLKEKDRNIWRGNT